MSEIKHSKIEDIPASITTIEEYAFRDCTSLTEINWNVIELTVELTESSDIFSNAGTNGSGITVIIGESVEEIPAYSFFAENLGNRPNITSVILPEDSIWIMSETKGAETGFEVTGEAETIAANIASLSTSEYFTGGWSSYYLIRTDN